MQKGDSDRVGLGEEDMLMWMDTIEYAEMTVLV